MAAGPNKDKFISHDQVDWTFKKTLTETINRKDYSKFTTSKVRH